MPYLPTFVTTITPAINVSPVTRTGGIPNPDSLHLLYFVDQKPPLAGETAVADSFHIINGAEFFERFEGGLAGGGSVRSGPRQILESSGQHTLVAVLVRDDNVVCAARSELMTFKMRSGTSGDEELTGEELTGAELALWFITVPTLPGIPVSVLLIWRAGRRRRRTRLELDPADTFRLITGWGVYRLNVSAGRVAGYRRELETKLNVTTTTTGSTSTGSTSSSSSTSTSVNSTTFTHDRFFIVDGLGRETPVHLLNWNVEVRDDQLVSMVLATPEKRGAERWALLRNHSSKRSSRGTFFDEVMPPPRSFLYRAFGFLLVFLGMFIVYPLLLAIILWWMQRGREKRVLAAFLSAVYTSLLSALDAAPAASPPNPNPPAASTR